MFPGSFYPVSPTSRAPDGVDAAIQRYRVPKPLTDDRRLRQASASGCSQCWARRLWVTRCAGIRHVGGGGLTDRGQWARSFIACGAPPGARFKTSSPMGRQPIPACAISVPLRAVNHGQWRGPVTRPDHRSRPLTAQGAQPSKLALRVRFPSPAPCHQAAVTVASPIEWRRVGRASTGTNPQCRSRA
jgi:hypothetical protein